MDLRWYVDRLRAMSPSEVARRSRDEAWHQAMRFGSHRWRPGDVTPAAPAALPSDARNGFDEEHHIRLLATADAIVAGRWTALGVTWTDLAPTPAWFRDPATGVASDPATYAFDLNPRDATRVGNVKNIWELSRHHHVTQLAAAYYLSGDDTYATTAASHLRSWWQENWPRLRVRSTASLSSRFSIVWPRASRFFSWKVSTWLCALPRCERGRTRRQPFSLVESPRLDRPQVAGRTVGAPLLH